MERRGSRGAAGLLVGIAVAVVIVLTGRAEASVAGIGAGPAAHAAANGEIKPTDCRSRRGCGSPLKGGLDIAFTGWSCTTGFLARDIETADLYVLTAGHCIAGSGLSARWSHDDSPIGRATFEAFHQGSNADVGAIAVTASGARNLVYGSSNSDIRQVTGSVPDASQTVGSKVCRSGGTSGWRCGSIVAADVDVSIEGRLIRNTWWTDFPSASGDSGASLLDTQGRAMGIVIATTATRSVYSTVDGIATELDAQICTDPECE
jgi:hypothetical protein